MSDSLLAACSGYVEAQSRHGRTLSGKKLPFITISREAGAGAVTIGRMVAENLNLHKRDMDDPPWTVFDRNLVEKVLEDNELPEKIKQFLPENTTFDLKDAVEELLGLHPSNWTLVQDTTCTILRLAHLGNVILVGRGSNIATARMSGGFHVRLVAPVERRIDHSAEFYKIDHDAAVQLVRKKDRGRRRYVKRYFNANIDDPLQYDVVINTGRMGFAAAADLIAEAVLQRAKI
jgi:cytidylate kinase